jgi:hypothetical protein
MACKSYWWVTRPKRKLILIPDLIKIFSATAEDQKWWGNRELHISFEQNLTDARWKAQNISKDGSGGRTYAALLAQFGLWYKDENNKVQITIAGQEIINGDPPVPIMTKQLMDLQFPSFYSLKRNINVCRDFQIQPYKFIMNLFLDKHINELTQDEIAFCLVPYAKKPNEVNLCLELIQRFHENPDAAKDSAIRDSGLNEESLRNIGNTIVNNLEYTGYFLEKEDIKSLEIRPEKIREASEFISQLRKGLIQNPENEQVFQRRYGTGLRTTKDYSTSIREPMEINPNEKKIIERFYIIAASEPIYSLTPRLINRISKQTGAPYQMVRSVIEKLPLETQPNQFRKSYLQISTAGKQFAKEFELKTANLFTEGFEVDAKWVGNKGRHPDIIVFLDKRHMRHGIIDTKAYRKYTLPLDHKHKMAQTYIPDLSKYEHEGTTYSISFFGYVAGGFSTNINNSFNELLNMTETPGHYITANNLLGLLKKHKEDPFDVDELMRLFSSNKEIISYEVISN